MIQEYVNTKESHHDVKLDGKDRLNWELKSVATVCIKLFEW